MLNDFDRQSAAQTINKRSFTNNIFVSYLRNPIQLKL